MVGRIISHWLVPMPVNDRYLILPESAGDVPSNGFIPIYLTESLVFGNGAHPTTALCLAALDDHLLSGAAVLDLGTGSGILSIAAALRGAASSLALDIDPDAVAAAHKNVALNAVEGIVTVRPGSLDEALRAAADQGGFDLTLVNILTPVILSFLDGGLAGVLKPGSILVAGGIEPREAPDIERSALRAGLTDVVISEFQGWAAVVARKP
ncbi:MAG: 50S ribosomal protein L11 methyltransferase [Planctomycetota bacterium]|jgi:ribosomal protein L11 methyltransferase